MREGMKNMSVFKESENRSGAFEEEYIRNMYPSKAKTRRRENEHYQEKKQAVWGRNGEEEWPKIMQGEKGMKTVG
jgi:hypothetical protein